MANFNDVVLNLQVNNVEEAKRDKNTNKNIAFLRESNKESFKEFINTQQQNTKVSQELLDSQSSK
jgi:hypothetical protein